MFFYDDLLWIIFATMTGFMIYCVVIAALAYWASRVARKKGFNPVGWVLGTVAAGCLWLLPALLVIVVMYVLPPKGESIDIDLPITTNSKVCPQCGERVRQIAKLCRYCQYGFQDI